MIHLYIIRRPLCRNRKFACLIKFTLWQIRSIFVKNELIVEWINNTKMSLTKGNIGLTGNHYCGFMEYEDMMFLLHYLRDDGLFIDVGANLGAYTNNAYDNVTEVSVTTLDKQYKLESSAVIKIDVEGYEPLVIDGREEFFQAYI
jgi:hypothetical protein